MRKFLLPTFVALLTLSIVGCGNTGCQETISVNARCSFYGKSDRRPFTFDSITVYGIGASGDSILYRRATGQSFVKLPLRKLTGESAYVFHFQGAGGGVIDQRDTLHLYHENINHFISEDCGAVVRHRVDSLSYTRHYLDSLVVAKPSIINLDEENIILLF